MEAGLFAVSRFTPLKRIDLLVRALAEPAAAGVRCTIAGDGEEAPRIRQLIRDHDLGARVTLLGAVDSATLVSHLASCRAVVFPAFEEDYGLVTVEAFASAKAVITCRDSGGPADWSATASPGLVCDPTPASLAAALATLVGRPGPRREARAPARPASPPRSPGRGPSIACCCRIGR